MPDSSRVKVLVTGASGFVGGALAEELCNRGLNAVGGVRTNPAEGQVAMGDIGPETEWDFLVSDFDTVIHAAARVHVMKETEEDPLAAFRRVNVNGTRRLAEQAAKAGVRRFIFLSSVKVNGESTEPGSPFTPFDQPRPEDPYGRSKWEAEQALMDVAAATGLEVVVIRPPLVYGHGVKGNLPRLLKLAQKGWPLPFGAIDNRRSLAGIDNLNDLIIRCIDHPAATGETFMVSDGDDLSTPDLIRKLAAALGKPARIFPVPPDLLRFLGCLAGKSGEIERLAGSLQVDIGHTCDTLDWRPPVPVDEGMKKLVDSLRPDHGHS